MAVRFSTYQRGFKTIQWFVKWTSMEDDMALVSSAYEDGSCKVFLVVEHGTILGDDPNFSFPMYARLETETNSTQILDLNATVGHQNKLIR